MDNITGFEFYIFKCWALLDAQISIIRWTKAFCWQLTRSYLFIIYIISQNPLNFPHFSRNSKLKKKLNFFRLFIKTKNNSKDQQMFIIFHQVNDGVDRLVSVVDIALSLSVTHNLDCIFHIHYLTFSILFNSCERSLSIRRDVEDSYTGLSIVSNHLLSRLGNLLKKYSDFFAF